MISCKQNKLISIIALLAVYSCNRTVDLQEAQLDFFEFFNPIYKIPDSMILQSCVVDVNFEPVSEREFGYKVDQIVAETGAGILYSNPVARNKIIYVAPAQCDLLKAKGFFPSNFFEKIIAFNTTDATDHPYVIRESDLASNIFQGDVADGTLAAYFEFKPPKTKEIAEQQVSDLSCVLNANANAKSHYGLPITYILMFEHSILYVFNSISYEESTVKFLIDDGQRSCGIHYDIELRKPTFSEQEYLSNLVASAQ